MRVYILIGSFLLFPMFVVFVFTGQQRHEDFPKVSMSREVAFQDSLLPQRLEIPELGLTSVISPVASSDYEADKQLSSGLIAIQVEGALIIAGHSSLPWWQRDKALFSQIDKLRQGSLVVVSNSMSLWSYEVTKKDIVAASDAFIFETPYPDTLFLYTCYPAGSTAKRLMVELHRLSGSMRFTYNSSSSS